MNPIVLSFHFTTTPQSPLHPSSHIHWDHRRYFSTPWGVSCVTTIHKQSPGLRRIPDPGIDKKFNNKIIWTCMVYWLHFLISSFKDKLVSRIVSLTNINRMKPKEAQVPQKVVKKFFRNKGEDSWEPSIKKDLPGGHLKIRESIWHLNILHTYRHEICNFLVITKQRIHSPGVRKIVVPHQSTFC